MRAIRLHEFGPAGRIKFVHFRDVEGTPERFYETFHDEGPTDLHACMTAYRDVGFTGHTFDGEDNERPGYESLGRLFALGYISGLREAVFGRRHA